jgi:hypothetical protein
MRSEAPGRGARGAREPKDLFLFVAVRKCRVPLPLVSFSMTPLRLCYVPIALAVISTGLVCLVVVQRIAVEASMRLERRCQMLKSVRPLSSTRRRSQRSGRGGV